MCGFYSLYLYIYSPTETKSDKNAYEYTTMQFFPTFYAITPITQHFTIELTNVFEACLYRQASYLCGTVYIYCRSIYLDAPVDGGGEDRVL